MTRRGTLKKSVGRTFGAAALWTSAIVVILPIAIVALTSLKGLREAESITISWPAAFHFDNYGIVFKDGKIFGGIWNSLVVTSCSTALILLCSSLLGFVIARRPSRFAMVLDKAVTLGLVAPFTALPTVMLLKTFGILGTRVALILVYSAMFLPFTTMMITAFVKTLPRELDEAAIIDGATALSLFRRIALPLLQAPLVTAFLLNAVWVWNDFMIPLYLLNSASRWTLPLSVFSFFGKYNHSWHLISANMVIVSAPVTVLYLLAQRSIISGMTTGAVKG